MNSEMKVTNYDILGERRMEDLVEHVREKLYEGWQPYGKVIFVKNEAACLWCQPMVKMEIYNPAIEKQKENINRMMKKFEEENGNFPMGKVPGISARVTVKKRGRPLKVRD